MIRPRPLAHAVERLDQPDHDPVLLETDLLHIEAVNRWLGGRRAMLCALAPLLAPGTSILDVGCGGGDIPRAIVAFAGRRDMAVHVTASDRQPQILDIARRRSVMQGAAAIRFVRAEGLALPFADASFDVVLMSLTLHHFEGEARVTALRELGRVARRRVIINELERCWPNYLGARLLGATVWRANSMARHDGPISVLRAFTAAELAADLRAAGLRAVRVERWFFHRLVAFAVPARA